MNHRYCVFTRKELRLSGTCLSFGLVGDYKPPFPFTCAAVDSLKTILREMSEISTEQETTVQMSPAEAALIVGGIEHSMQFL